MSVDHRPTPSAIDQRRTLASRLLGSDSLWRAVPWTDEITERCLELGVDPRWLATGVPSPSAVAAIEAVERAKNVSRLDTLALRMVLTALTVEPDCGGGECRYCGCTDERSCGDCYWVDAAATICSACLIDEDPS